MEQEIQLSCSVSATSTPYTSKLIASGGLGLAPDVRANARLPVVAVSTLSAQNCLFAFLPVLWNLLSALFSSTCKNCLCCFCARPCACCLYCSF